MTNLPQKVVVFSGAALIAMGMVAAIAQLMGELQLFNMKPPQIVEPASGRHAETSDFKVSTHYVGVELIVIGAVLELAGLFGHALALKRGLVPADDDKPTTK